MRTTSQPRPNSKIAANADLRMRQFRNSETTGLRQPNARAPQNARMKYERYLALARVETLAGDQIAAENYYQHAEHYLRSMREHAN
jgi:uncharacterized MAPEG superfamily protein